jgi:hypothetical protein
MYFPQCICISGSFQIKVPYCNVETLILGLGLNDKPKFSYKLKPDKSTWRVHRRRISITSIDLLKKLRFLKILRSVSHDPYKAAYTLSVKLSDFTVWRHIWRKNWVNCAVLTGNSAGLRTVFPVVFHPQNRAVHSGKTTVSSVYLPTPLWHHLKELNRTDTITDKPDEHSVQFFVQFFSHS